jgi:hypothetical protein
VLVAGLGFFWWFPAAYRRSFSTMVALVLGVCMPLPLLGLLFLGFFRGSLDALRATKKQASYCFGERQVLTHVALGDNPGVSARSVLDTLRHWDAEARRRAIMALRGIDPRRAIPILQKAMQDSDDQVRLFAQAVFNGILSELEESLKNMEAKLAQGPRTPDGLARLAEKYHEPVYLELCNVETEKLYLNRAVELLTEVLQLAPGHKSARLLLLRCQLRKRDAVAARRCLEEMKERGAQREFLTAWEAEVLYLEKNWAALTRALEEMQHRRMTPARMREICQFWLPPKPVLP